MTTAEAQRWKEFNSYEMRDFRQKQREALKAEINNISHKIASAREAQGKASAGGSTYGGFATTQASWKVPEIEQINRNFNENARFFTTSKNERRHGLKYVPPPVAENVQQLLEEKAAAEMNKNNYLLNSRFVRGANNAFDD